MSTARGSRPESKEEEKTLSRRGEATRMLAGKATGEGRRKERSGPGLSFLGLSAYFATATPLPPLQVEKTERFPRHEASNERHETQKRRGRRRESRTKEEEKEDHDRHEVKKTKRTRRKRAVLKRENEKAVVGSKTGQVRKSKGNFSSRTAKKGQKEGKNR